MTLALDDDHSLHSSTEPPLVLVGHLKLSTCNKSDSVDTEGDKENAANMQPLSKSMCHHRSTSPTTVLLPPVLVAPIRRVRFHTETVTHVYELQEDEEAQEACKNKNCKNNSPYSRVQLAHAFQDQGYDLLLSQVYQTPLSHLQALALLPEYTADGIPNLRGLEQYACPGLAYVRHEHRRRMRKAVLDRAYILRVENQCSPGQQRRLLAHFAQRYSAPAVLFAQHLGTADCVAARQPDTNVFAFHLARQLWQQHEAEMEKLQQQDDDELRQSSSCQVLPQYTTNGGMDWNPTAWILKFLGVNDMEPFKV